jgi:plasmid stabilization system protein ParE
MIEWTKQAVIQLEQARDYVALSNSEEAADKIAVNIVRHVEQLEVFPMSGRTGRVTGMRELVMPNTPFIAAYARERHRLVILAIYHGTQRWPEVL